jgi:hypothetical protein
MFRILGLHPDGRAYPFLLLLVMVAFVPGSFGRINLLSFVSSKQQHGPATYCNLFP